MNNTDTERQIADYTQKANKVKKNIFTGFCSNSCFYKPF